MEKKTIKRIPFLEDHLLIIIVFLISLCVMIVYYTGYYGTDDVVNYIPNIFQIMNGQTPSRVARLPLIFLGIFSYKLFGNQIDAIPYLFSLLYPTLILLTYILTNLISNKKTAQIAAILTFGTSLIFLYSGALLPDNLLSCFILLAYIFITLSYKAQTNKKRTLFAILSGLFTLLTFLTKEPYLLIFIGFFPLAIHFKVDFKTALKTALIVLATFIAFYVVNKLILTAFGFPFSFFSIKLNNYLDVYIEANQTRNTETLPKHILYSILILTALGKTYYIFLTIMILISFFHSLIKKDLLSLTFSLSFLLTFIYFATASVSFEQYIGLPIQARYFIPLYLFSIIATSLLINYIGLLKWKHSHWITIFVLLFSLSQIHLNLHNAGDFYHATRQRVFIQIIDELSQNHPNQPLQVMYSCNEDCNYFYQYDLYYTYTEKNINFIDYIPHNTPIVSKDAVFLGELTDEKLTQAAQQYAQENDLVYVERIQTQSETKPYLIPFVTQKHKQNLTDRGFKYGYFIEP